MGKKVSVVMCTYNGAKYLKEQLDSIINQTYPISELIIQDDCSTDSTWEILETYASKHSYIRVFRNVRNEGVNKNFFSILKKATGEFVAISDQDDIWELDKLQTQVETIGDNMLSCGFSCPFALENNVRIHFDARIPNYTMERMLYVGVIAGNTILMKKSFLKMFFSISNIENTRFTYDQLLSLLAASYGGIQFCNKILVHHRRHINAATYTPPNDYRINYFNLIRIFLRTFSLYRKLRPQIREYFRDMYALLRTFPEDAIYKVEPLKLAYLHSQSSFGAYVQLTFLCVKLRYRISYTKENNELFSLV